MAKEIYGPGSPPHQTETQERVFQQVLKRLCEKGPAGDEFRRKVLEESELEHYNLSAEQQAALIGIGHAAGKYAYEPGYGFCCCCGPQNSELLPPPAETWEGNLGPLAPLAGTWEGDKGYDTSPSKDRGTKTTRFRELIKFDPFGPKFNHKQVLYGLRYSITAWPLGEAKPFHEELGYWLWDFREKQVLRCLIIPRGVTVLAGGTVEPDAKQFELFAEAGSETYGICSNKFLDKEFKTVRFELKVTIHDDRSFSYDQDTQLQIKGQTNIFHHTDKNTLIRSK